MRIKLSLLAKNRSGNVLPVNYQYPFSSAIYKTMSRADEAYAAFLHEKGYRSKESLKTFKLFTFSDIHTPFTIKGDRLFMKTEEVDFMVCFHIPEAATNFIKGLFIDQQIDIADKKSKVSFVVHQVEALPLWNIPVAPDEVKEVVLKPASPLIVGIINDKGYYDFLGPDDARYLLMITHHIKEKHRVVYGDDVVEDDFKVFEVAVLDSDRAKSRLLTIKAGEPEETKIRGFVGFKLKIKAKVRVIELALNAGIGVYGSQGFGCVKEV